MKMWLRLAVLVVLPLLFGLATLYILDAKGPYWLYSNSDSDYIHLFGALNVARGVNPSSDIIHPGTGLHVTGAGVIRLLHTLRQGDLQGDVLQHPEIYLAMINRTMLALQVGLLIMLGLLMYQATKQWLPALCVQLTPFFSPDNVFFSSARMSSEHMHLICAYGIAGVMTVILMSGYCGWRQMSAYAVALGFWIGLGTATKVSFAVMLLIPLIALPGIVPRLIAVVSSIFFAILFVLPNSRGLGRFLGYIPSLFLHGGRPGEDRQFFNMQRFLSTLHDLIRAEQVLFHITVAALVVIGLSLIVAIVRRRAPGITLRLVMASCITQLTQGLIVARNPPLYQITAVLGLTGLTLALTVALIYELTQESALTRAVGRVATYLGITWLLWRNAGTNMRTFIRAYDRFSSDTRAHLAVRKKVEEYRDYTKIFYYRSSSPEYALTFGDGLSFRQNATRLAKLYPQPVFFWLHGDYYYDWLGTRLTFERIRSMYPKLVFQGSIFKGTYQPTTPLRLVYQCGEEGIYVPDDAMMRAEQHVAEWLASMVPGTNVYVYTRTGSTAELDSVCITVGAAAATSNMRLYTDVFGTTQRPVLVSKGILPNVAEFEVLLPHKGTYELAVTMATGEARPFDVYVNNQLMARSVAARVTGGVTVSHACLVRLGQVELPAGASRVRLQRDAGPLPHLVELTVNK